MNLDYLTIGNRIKFARLKAGLTQEKLAEIVDISTSHMSNIETGTTKVSLVTLVNLANALFVSVDELLSDNVIQSRPIFEADIKRLLDSCDEHEIRIVKRQIESLLDTLREDAAFKQQTRRFYSKGN